MGSEILPALALMIKGPQAERAAAEELWEAVKLLAENGIYLFSDALAFAEALEDLRGTFEGIDVVDGNIMFDKKVAEEVCQIIKEKAELGRRCLSGEDEACEKMGLSDPRINTFIRTLIEIYLVLEREGRLKCS